MSEVEKFQTMRIDALELEVTKLKARVKELESSNYHKMMNLKVNDPNFLSPIDNLEFEIFDKKLL